MRNIDQVTDIKFFLIMGVLCCLAVSSCTPTVKVDPPEEPITINIKLDADIRVKLEEEAKKDIATNPGIF